MKGKDVLFLLLCLGSAGFALWKMIAYLKAPAGVINPMALYMAIGGAVVAGIFGVLFLAGRVNKEEEIHITQ
jgi:hypothetical protein